MYNLYMIKKYTGKHRTASFMQCVYTYYEKRKFYFGELRTQEKTQKIFLGKNTNNMKIVNKKMYKKYLSKYVH